MKLKFKDTLFTLIVKNTENSIGLKEGDTWCNISLTVDNSEFHYEISRESLSKNEVLNGLDKIKKYYYDKDNSIREITFIKNYFTLKFDSSSIDRTMELKLISLAGKKEKAYSVYFTGDEIEKFVELSQIKE